MGNSGAVCFAASRLRVREREELFAEPDRNFGFSGSLHGRATLTGSGVRLSGEWPLVTGVRDASWCVLLGQIWDGDAPALVDGRPDIRQFLVPTEALQIDPTWDRAVAMRGTGSHRVILEPVDLPEWCALRPAAPLGIDRPLFRLGSSLAVGSVVCSAVATGILRSAVDAAAGDLSSKVSTFTGDAASANVALLEMINECYQAHRTLRAGLLAATDCLWESAQAGGRGSDEERADVFGLMHYAVKVARQTISELYGRTSFASFFDGHPLERALRDIHAVHYGTEPLRQFEHSAGLVRLGKRPVAPMF